MGLPSLFRSKRSKPAKPPDPPVESIDATNDDSIPTQKSEQLPKLSTANAIQPLNDAKVTSFPPPPLSIDASVITDPQNVTSASPENEKKERSSFSRDKNDKDDLQADEKKKEDAKRKEEVKSDACDSKTCTKEKCLPETCRTSLKKQSDPGDVINTDRLTEMLNSSIKEAVQIIAKQCRMKHEEEKILDQKPKGEFDKSVCYTKKEEIPVKTKHESRPHAVQDHSNRTKFSKISQKSCRPQEKYNIVRCSPKKLHDEIVKCKKENVCEDSRSKRHSKTANVKTDNRRMTGNVNIYICSEANENTQPTSKQKKSQPCAESSSETTTERSNISSSKLVTSIRNKRRKFKEQNSFDCLPCKEESSENSNACSFVSQSTESSVTTKLESSDFIDVCANDTESTLTECQCKDANISNSDVSTDKSDLSFESTKFVVCDQMEKPCSRIYSSKVSSITDSEEWSSKSVCSNDMGRVLRAQNRGDGYCRSNYRENDLKRGHDIDEEENFRMLAKRSFENVCKCRRKDLEPVIDSNAQGSCRSKKRSRRMMEKENSRQPWSTCSCIEEEEEKEEDVFANDRPARESTVCRRLAEQTQEEETTVCPGIQKSSRKQSIEIADSKEDEVKLTEGSPEDLAKPSEDKEKIVQEDQARRYSKTKETEGSEPQGQEAAIDDNAMPAPYTFPKLIRPETRALKYILGQYVKPPAETTERKSVIDAPVKKIDTLEDTGVKNANDAQTPAKTEPAYLKKFNLREQHKFMKSFDAKKSIHTLPGEQSNRTPLVGTEKKSLEDKEGGKDTETKTTFQNKLKHSFLFRTLKKITEKNKTERPENQTEQSTEKDKSAEENSADATDKKIEDPEAKINGELPAKSKAGKKKSRKGKEKSGPSKSDEQKLNKKEDKTEPVASAEKKTPPVEGNNKSSVSDGTSKTLYPTNKKENDAGAVVIEEKQNKSKSSTEIPDKEAVEITDPTKAHEFSKKSEFQDVTKELESQVSRKESDVKRKSIDQGKLKVESRKSIDHHRELAKETVAEMRPDFGKETVTVCVNCVQRKMSSKKPRQSIASHHAEHCESELHTVCTNSKFPNCLGVGDSFNVDKEKLEDSRCNCCYLPTTQCSNTLADYPKSCLKKDKQFRRIGSRENSCSIFHRDNRSWEDCDCRRVLVCDNCCRPRNECSCRLTITCVNCCKPKNECNCKSICNKKNVCRCMKSMFCLYCDHPREKCVCRAPLQKCSCCELSVDLCMCEDRKTYGDGRPVLTEPENERTMYVTAWKPREEVRRYFSRNLEDRRADSINECRCHEKLKSRNSDDLPYQRLSVFSDVMDELQQKISESTCCTQCRKVPCCCSAKVEKDEGREERKMKYCVSPKTRRKIVAVCVEKPKSKPVIVCKCDAGQTKGDKQRKIIVPICCACKSTPCRCRKSKSSQKKPRAKCYYCKSSPCVCNAIRERGKPRPCRCTDSPCRTREKEIVPCGKTSTKPKNNEEKIICVR